MASVHMHGTIYLVNSVNLGSGVLVLVTQELEVYCVSLYDLSALSALTELRELDLHTLQEANCLHTDSLSPLSSLTKLRALGLQGSDASIVDACPWHSMTGLTRVDLHGSCVSDLAPLRRLAGLHALDLTGRV